MNTKPQQDTVPSPWSWLVYMAADNDLADEADIDINEMRQAKDPVRVAVHADVRTRQTLQTVIDGNGNAHAPIVLSENANSGDGKVLTRFIRWGKLNAAADKHVVCIWNHGNGPLDFVLPPQPQAQTAAVDGPRTAAVGSDDFSRDFLREREAAEAFAAARDDGEGPFAIIGFDACYMAMVEVAYAIRDQGVVMVASQNEEPPAGWNYRLVLSAFRPKHGINAGARAIVDAYREQFPNDPLRTLSAIRLEKMNDLCAALDRLGTALLTVLDDVDGFASIKRARGETTSMLVNSFIDLSDFASTLVQYAPAHKGIVAAATEVHRVVEEAVIANINRPGANGISIYVPKVEVANEYKELDFAKAAPEWARFVKEYPSRLPRPAAF